MSSANGSSARRDGYAVPAEWRHQIWLAVLVLAVSAFSLVFACAAPFAAFGAMAAVTLSRRDAVRTTLALWAVNQAIGFGLLGYPRTANSFAWGLAIGAAAVLGTLAAQWIVARLRVHELLLVLSAFVGAFAVYEAALLAVAVAGLGGLAAFGAPIMGQVALANLEALVGLALLHRLGAALGWSRARSQATRQAAASSV